MSFAGQVYAVNAVHIVRVLQITADHGDEFCPFVIMDSKSRTSSVPTIVS